jgi:hypothetical protein
MLQYSLQQKVTYWLRTCTPTKTEEMATLVDACIVDAVEAATCIDFDEKDIVEKRIRLPAQMMGGGSRNRRT